MPKSQPKKAAPKKSKAAPAKASKSAVRVSSPKSKPAAPNAKATPIASKPKPAAAKPAARKAKPVVAKAKPAAPKAKPVVLKAKPVPAKAKPAAPVGKTPATAAVKKTPKTELKQKPEKPKKATGKITGRAKEVQKEEEVGIVIKPGKITAFHRSQREKLQALRDLILDSMAGVAKDTLRSRPEGGEASAFGMHQADAGSDAYDKDFALSLLSQEQDALYEIEEAMKRVDAGTYGMCEMSGKPIPVARLEALPFARYTVECQSELERTKRQQRSRVPVTSLFGLTDSEEEDGDGEEAEEKTEKPQNEE